MKKIFTILFSTILLSFSVKAQTLTYDWAVSGGGEGADRAATITSDADGNVYATGVFQNAAIFSNINLSGSAKGSGANFDNSLYLTKLVDGSKTIAWAIYSNKGAVNPTSVTTSANGDVILVGNVRAVKGGETTAANIIDAEGTETIIENLADAATGIRSFIAKFDSNGKKIWIKTISSTSGKNDISDVVTDDDGNIYIVGYYDKDITFPEGSQITASSTQSSFVAKLDGSNGSQFWVKGTSGGLKREDLNVVAFDGTDIYVGGTFTNEATSVEINFGGVDLQPSAYPDIVVAKLNKEGNFAYVQMRKHTLSTSSNTMVKDLVVSNSNIYLSGSFKGELGFSGGNIVSATNLNGFVAAFDAVTGADSWQKTAACPAITESSAITLLGNYIGVFGYFYNKLSTNVGSVDFGGGITLTTGDTNTKGDLFFAIYDLAGNIVKAESIATGDGSDVSMSVTSVSDDVYIFGHFNSVDANGAKPLAFLGTTETLSTAGGFDFFVAKYTTSDFGSSIEDTYNPSGSNIYVKDGNIHIEGDAITSVDIYSASGSIVSKLTYGQGEDNIEISVSSLPKGLYIVKTKSASGNIQTAKVLF